MKNSPNSDASYSHVLQKAGILKNFSVAKVVTKKEIDELKKLVKAVSKSEEEYEKLLSEEMHRISNMHNKRHPIPGIIYTEDKTDQLKLLKKLSNAYSGKLKAEDINKKELCFLISSIIKELGLTAEDFTKFSEDQNLDDDDDEDGIKN